MNWGLKGFCKNEEESAINENGGKIKTVEELKRFLSTLKPIRLFQPEPRTGRFRRIRAVPWKFEILKSKNKKNELNNPTFKLILKISCEIFKSEVWSCLQVKKDKIVVRS